LVRLGEQLDSLRGKGTVPSVGVECSNLEEAIDFTESAVAPFGDLQERLAAEKAQSEKLEEALETERRARAHLEQELQGRRKLSWMFSRQDSPCVSETKPDDEIKLASSFGKPQPRGLMCFNWFAGK
jgi:hypothetical protein